jgi:hypothetical protein
VAAALVAVAAVIVLLAVAGSNPRSFKSKRLPSVNFRVLTCQRLNQKKKVPIFYRSERNTTDYLYNLFPVEGIMLFCNKARDSVQSDKAVYLPDGDTVAWRAIFDWIQRCMDAQAIEDFEVASNTP